MLQPPDVLQGLFQSVMVFLVPSIDPECGARVMHSGFTPWFLHYPNSYHLRRDKAICRFLQSGHRMVINEWNFYV